MKKIILSLLVSLTTTGAWAQSPTVSGITWNTGTNSGTFTMPAYDVEVSTELWYCLDEAKDNSSLASQTNVFLKRTIKAGVWNSFCAPFDITNPANVFGEGVLVKELNTATLEGGTLTLNFTNPTTGIEACKPYLIKLPGSESVNLAADGKEFAGVSQSYTAVPKEIASVVTFQPTITPAAITAYNKTVLFLTADGKLTWAKNAGTIKAFRAYFQLPNNGGTEPVLAREFVLDFGDETVTGIIGVTTNTDCTDNTDVYDLQGRKVAYPTVKGIYIQNGKKVVIR
jgi:hypothetical protein